MKKCPFCAEEIQDEAIKCRYCGELLEETSPVVINGVELSPEAVRTIDEFVLLGKTKEAAKTIREATGLGGWESGRLAYDWEITSKNMPCCPTCGSRNIRKLSAAARLLRQLPLGFFH